MWKENRSVWFEAPKDSSDCKGTAPVDVGSAAPALAPGNLVPAANEAAADCKAAETFLALATQPSTIESLEAKINGLPDKAGKIAAIKEAHDATGTAIKDLAQKISVAENTFKNLKNSPAGSKDFLLRVIDKNFPVLYGNLQALEANYASETGAVIAVGHPRNPESSFDGNVRMFLEYHNAIAPALEKANADLKQVVAMNNEAAEKLQAQAKVSAVVAGT